MRFEVPQFIEVEAKIVGPLTWKQFVYIAGGVGLLIILYVSGLPFFAFVVIGLPIAALAGSLAFHKVNERPFSIFLEAIFNYLMKNKLYLWKRKEMQSIIERGEEAYPSTANLTYTNNNTIPSLARNLEIHNPHHE